MQINVHDNNMHYIAVLNNDLPKALHFTNDNWHRYLTQAAATFDLTINKMVNGSLSPDAALITDQCYLSFKDERGNDQVFNIMIATEDDTTLTLNCYSTTLKLLQGQANLLNNTVAHSLWWYLQQLGITTYAGITLGVNEVSSKLLTLSFDTQDTYGVQLLSLINSFEAEFEFITPLNSNGTLKSITLNVYQAGDGVSTQGVGTIRDDVTLVYGKNVIGVTRISDKTTLFNASTVTDSNGKVNWNSLSFEKKNANGDVEFYKKAGNVTAYAPISAQMYLSQTPNGGTPYTRKDFSIDAKTADDLTTYVLSQFAQYAYPSITYNVTASSILLTSDYSLGIGDTIKVKDDNFSGGLLLQARVSEIVICSTNHANDLVVLSNYVKLKSQISDGSIEQMQALIKAATPYVASISTTNGVTFKNSTGSTVLTAHIYLGSSSNETIADDYEWFKDGVLLLSAQGLTVNASDFTDKAVYRFQATINGNTVATQEVTITNVSDGISPINLVIESSNGYQFKNNVINTTLTARLFQGNEEIDANGTDFSYVWTKTNSDGTDDTTWNLQHQAGTKTITITNSDLWQRATFDCIATSLN